MVDRVMTQLVGTLQGKRVKWFTDKVFKRLSEKEV